MRTTSLVTTTLGFKPLTGLGAPAPENPARADAPGKLCLWSDRPAKTWMTEALPIGNGPMGAMLFGGTAIERVQFTEISLWTGDRMAVQGRVLGESDAEVEQNLGAYQAFGDILIHLGHDFNPFFPAPFSPPSGPVTGSFNGLHPKSNFLLII